MKQLLKMALTSTFTGAFYLIPQIAWSQEVPHWKMFQKPSQKELAQKLTSIQFSVTQKEDTEAPFKNEFWNNHEEGIYVDIVSGEPLFSSLDKFDSGTGWPSFSRAIEKENIVEKIDRRLFGTRTEVRSKYADSHLGHVFDDGPAPTGLRYCMNSASLKFIPKGDLKSKGYETYLSLFEKSVDKSSAIQKEKLKTALETAIFAGGCFWCMEPPFEKLKGVTSVVSGYTGGHTDKPSYEDVSHKDTGHLEAVQITFDPNLVSYNDLLKTYWNNVDPIDRQGQFCDKGPSYLSAIFYQNDAQKKQAEKSLANIQASPHLVGKTIATKLIPAKTFFEAEEYHQDYYKKNPVRYKYYRFRCGRDQRLEEIWGKSKQSL